MNIYELILLMWATILTGIFIYFVIDMLGRTKNLYDDVINIKSYTQVWLDPQIKRIRQLVTDEIINKKEDVSTTETDIDKCVNIIEASDYLLTQITDVQYREMLYSMASDATKILRKLKEVES